MRDDGDTAVHTIRSKNTPSGRERPATVADVVARLRTGGSVRRIGGD